MILLLQAQNQEVRRTPLEAQTPENPTSQPSRLDRLPQAVIRHRRAHLRYLCRRSRLDADTIVRNITRRSKLDSKHMQETILIRVSSSHQSKPCQWSFLWCLENQTSRRAQAASLSFFHAGIRWLGRLWLRFLGHSKHLDCFLVSAYLLRRSSLVSIRAL